MLSFFSLKNVKNCKDGFILAITPILFSPLLIFNYHSPVCFNPINSLLFINEDFCFVPGITLCFRCSSNGGVLDISANTISGNRIITGGIISIIWPDQYRKSMRTIFKIDQYAFHGQSYHCHCNGKQRCT